MYRKGRIIMIHKLKNKGCTVELLTTHALMPRQFPSSNPEAAFPPVYKMRWSTVLAACAPKSTHRWGAVRRKSPLLSITTV